MTSYLPLQLRKTSGNCDNRFAKIKSGFLVTKNHGIPRNCIKFITRNFFAYFRGIWTIPYSIRKNGSVKTYRFPWTGVHKHTILRVTYVVYEDTFRLCTVAHARIVYKVDCSIFMTPMSRGSFRTGTCCITDSKLIM